MFKKLIRVMIKAVKGKWNLYLWNNCNFLYDASWYSTKVIDIGGLIFVDKTKSRDKTLQLKVRWNKLVPKLKLPPDICAQDTSIQISTLLFLHLQSFWKILVKVFLEIFSEKCCRPYCWTKTVGRNWKHQWGWNMETFISELKQRLFDNVSHYLMETFISELKQKLFDNVYCYSWVSNPHGLSLCDGDIYRNTEEI